MEGLNKRKIIIYKSDKGDIELRMRLENETIWLNSNQIALIFGVNRPAIVKHINNIYKAKELSEKSTCSKMEQVAADGKRRKMNFYNLDMIISVGYRINSQRATSFRIWATKILKQYLLNGYSLNRKKLLETKNKFSELRETISFLQKKLEKKLIQGQEKEIFNLLADYSKTLSLLEQYDKNTLRSGVGKKSKFVLKYDNCTEIINSIKK